ncbi:unnamed protein product [Mytilus coruscus]|uniref:Uncharacterized protein n=1 Tax=Mytilus coruscus TaxID=42192 RepID=A0A6J8EED4_MYTCO|nr:unnamed protein product [Mytilus coruscus]
MANHYGVGRRFPTIVEEINMIKTCFNKTNQTNSTILPCKTALGNQSVRKCGIFNGTIILNQPSFHLDILTEITAKGCFDVDKSKKTGCYTDPNMLNEQKANLENFLEKEIEHLEIQIVNVTNGQFCINPISTVVGIEKATNKSVLAIEDDKNRSAIFRFKYCSTLVFVTFIFSVLCEL